ncbi:MAG: hypothetical protein ACFFCS_29025 [Candidatus Hodarchaeota archaeon]
MHSTRTDEAKCDFIQGDIADHTERGCRSTTHFIEEKLRDDIKRIRGKEKDYSKK